MNREVEYRGFDGREWRYGDLGYNRKDDVARIHTYKDDGSYNKQYLVDPYTVGEFTGLRDKNGKKIFEGDIVECVSWNEYFSKDGQPMEPFRRKMYVDFRRGGYKMVEPMPEPMKDNEWDIIYNGDIVIVGNIYDNSELLSTK